MFNNSEIKIGNWLSPSSSLDFHVLKTFLFAFFITSIIEWICKQGRQSSWPFYYLRSHGLWCEDFLQGTYQMQELWLDRCLNILHFIHLKFYLVILITMLFVIHFQHCLGQFFSPEEKRLIKMKSQISSSKLSCWMGNIALGPVSRKSRKLFGPEKPFVKLRPAYSVKLVFSYVVKGIKIKITAKFRASIRLRFEDT